MSEEKQKTDNAAKEMPAVPHAWLRTLLGLGVCLVVTALCAVAVVRYVKTRPVNLRGYSLGLVEKIDKTLAANRVPEANIRKGEPALRTGNGATWYLSEYDVDVPETLDAAGLAKVIGRTMLDYNVSSALQQPDESTRMLGLSLGEYEIALIRLTQKQQRKDLTETCDAAAKDVASLFTDRGISPQSIAQSEPGPREDETSIWSTTRFDVDIPAGFSLFETEAALRDKLAPNGVMVRTQTDPDGTTRWALECEGRTIADVVLHAAPTPAAGQQTAEETATPPAPEPEPALSVLPDLLAPPALDSGPSTDIPFAPSAQSENGTAVVPPSPEATSSPADAVPKDGNATETPPAQQESTTPPVSDTADAAKSATPAQAATGPRVAIIVDDGGYNEEAAAGILALTNRLTVAIIPFTTHDTETATKAKELGFEVMLHVPMQESHVKDQLTTTMTPVQIAEIVNAGLARVPGAVGVNNHTGSTFMADEPSVRAFLEVIKDKPLFFIDSKTTAKSKGVEVAKSLGIPVASRDVFLDLEKDPNWFRGQFQKLIDIAKKHGNGIAICHFKPTTVELLKECLPRLEMEGIQVVHVSEMLE